MSAHTIHADVSVATAPTYGWAYGRHFYNIHRTTQAHLVRASLKGYAPRFDERAICGKYLYTPDGEVDGYVDAPPTRGLCKKCEAMRKRAERAGEPLRLIYNANRQEGA